MSNLLPHFEKMIIDVFDSLNLSNERRAAIQPMIEKNIQQIRETDDEGGTVVKALVVDDSGKPRLDSDGKPIQISQLVKEVHEKIDEKGTPILKTEIGDDAVELSNEQLMQVAAGTLKLEKKEPTADKDAIPASEVLSQHINPEDVASGKVKIDANK